MVSGGCVPPEKGGIKIGTTLLEKHLFCVFIYQLEVLNMFFLQFLLRQDLIIKAVLPLVLYILYHFL